MTQGRAIQVDARPNPLTIDPSETAVIVVDMQNDFGADGGMFARAGIPISDIKAAVGPTARVLAAARGVGVKIVYLKMEFESDLSDAGGSDAPNLVRHLALGVGEPVEAPDGSLGRILIKDTWNTEIVAELAPEPGDIIVSKHRFSGFYETDLESILEDWGVKYLVFCGCTTSVCVESTIRDAFYRDYRCLLLTDCTAEPIGSDPARSNYRASILLIETFFGWVSESTAFLQSLAGQPLSRT